MLAKEETGPQGPLAIVPSFVHQLALPGDAEPPSSVWLLLHGTEGGETEVIPHAQSLLPRAALISPRGKALSNDPHAPRFYRLLSQTVMDIEDVRFRARELAGFLRAACREYGLPSESAGVMGFESGATMAAALLLLEPCLFRSAILFRPMLPFEPALLPDLSARRVLIATGKDDLLISPEEVHSLERLLGRCGAEVTVSWQDCGRGLTQADLEAAGRWLARHEENGSEFMAYRVGAPGPGNPRR